MNPFASKRVSLNGLLHATSLLARGEVVAFPTETVYGMGADARNAQALAKIFALKGRPADHPLIVHIASANEMERYARVVTPAAHALAAAFWPGPLTLILPRAESIDPAATGGHDTVGLRVPNHPVALDLLRAFDGPIAAPSANRFGRISPTTAQHVRDEFGDTLACIVDGGECNVGIESTIVDLSHEQPAVLRPGHITPRQIEAVLGGNLGNGKDSRTPAPGTLEAHYAPRLPLFLATAQQIEEAPPLEESVILHLKERQPARGASVIAMPSDPGEYARVLYANLRRADASGAQRIVVEIPPATEQWQAVLDRLRRAAASSL